MTFLTADFFRNRLPQLFSAPQRTQENAESFFLKQADMGPEGAGWDQMPSRFMEEERRLLFS
jgi:hypothetical protein